MKRPQLKIIELVVVSVSVLAVSSGCEGPGETEMIDVDHASFGAADDYAAYDDRVKELARGQEE